MKQKNDAFKTPAATTTITKKPLLELNSSKDDDDSSSEDDLPLNLVAKDQPEIKSNKRKRQIEKVKKITSIIDAFNIDKLKEEQESPVKEKSLKQRRKDKKKLKKELEELDDCNVKKKKKATVADDDDEEMIASNLEKEPKHIKKIGYKLDGFHISPSKSSSKKVRITTPIRNKKKSKSIVEPLPELAEDNEHNKNKRRDSDDDDDDEGEEKCSASKRVKINDEPLCDEEDDIDKINSIHHQNVPFKHKAVQVTNDNFENSSKKDKKKGKKKKKDIGFSTSEWELKQSKKHENIEKKKQKRLKNMERRDGIDGRLSAKKLKKLAKQQLIAGTMETS